MQERLLAPERMSMTGRSSLVLAGDVTIEALELDGALEVIAEPGAQAHIKRLVVQNDGWALVRSGALTHLYCAQSARHSRAHVALCRNASQIGLDRLALRECVLVLDMPRARQDTGC